jgi:hypothetical protein
MNRPVQKEKAGLEAACPANLPERDQPVQIRVAAAVWLPAEWAEFETVTGIASAAVVPQATVDAAAVTVKPAGMPPAITLPAAAVKTTAAPEIRLPFVEFTA